MDETELHVRVDAAGGVKIANTAEGPWEVFGPGDDADRRATFADGHGDVALLAYDATRDGGGVQAGLRLVAEALTSPGYRPRLGEWDGKAGGYRIEFRPASRAGRIDVRYGEGRRDALLDMRNGRIYEYAEPTDGITPTSTVHAVLGGEQYYVARSGLSGAGWVARRPGLFKVPTLRVDVGRVSGIQVQGRAMRTLPGMEWQPLLVFRRGERGKVLWLQWSQAGNTLSVDVSTESGEGGAPETTPVATATAVWFHVAAPGFRPQHAGEITVNIHTTPGVDRRTAWKLLDAVIVGEAPDHCVGVDAATRWEAELGLGRFPEHLEDDRWLYYRHGRVEPKPGGGMPAFVRAVAAQAGERPDARLLYDPARHTVVGDDVIVVNDVALLPPWRGGYEVDISATAVLALWRGDEDPALAEIRAYEAEANGEETG